MRIIKLVNTEKLITSTKLNHKGSAIMLSIFAMVFILSLVCSYTYLLNSQVMITRNHGYDAQAFCIAETGLDHMLWRLFDSDGYIDDVSSNDTQTFNAGSDTFSAGTYSYDVTVSEATDGALTLDSTGSNADLSGTDFTREVTLTLTNLALSGTATASSEALLPLPPKVASRANDGDRGTAWQADAAGEQWIYIDLDATYTVSKVMYRCNLDSFIVQTSNDALAWTAVTNSYQEPASPASPDNIYVVFDDVSCQYVRLYEAVAPSAPVVYEFFIYTRPEAYDFSEDFSS